MEIETRLKYFPISFFSVIMGLTGFTIALQRAEEFLSFGSVISTYLLYIVLFTFIGISVLYFIKTIKHFPSVMEEINSPVRLSFFPTFTISLLLLSTAFLEVNTPLSKILCIVGMVMHFIATIAILSLWIQQTKFEINHFSPAWFIPIVGNILVPISGSKHFSAELSWFFFSIGIIFWVLLFTIFLYRILFHNPLPEKILPTFFILIAPPAVGFISYVKLNGAVDNFAKILYFFALFLVILLISQINLFSKMKFYLSWWAFTFPIAAITIATSLMYEQTGLAIYKTIFFVLMIPFALFMIYVLLNTFKATFKNEICVKED